jgi:3-oxoacyl-[acyl-carrier-protein] synthase II
MSSDTRVVVTGLGATTPVGGTVPQTWEAILAGRSGARPMEFDWVSQYELPVTFAAQIHTPPDQVLAKVETRRLDPSSQYALIAAREAWADAGSPEVEPERLASRSAPGSAASGRCSPVGHLAREGTPPGLPARRPHAHAQRPRRCNLARPRRARRRPHARQRLRLGRRGHGVCRAAHPQRPRRRRRRGWHRGAMHPMPIAGFAAMQALSTRNDDPAAASRPYDTDRDGFVLGEGAAIIVLESEEHAKARGARIYAELAGVGMSADAHHITAPEPEGAGASRAMLEAIATAGGTPADVVHINAHATSTPVGDVAEANAIRRAFGGPRRLDPGERDQVDDRSPARRGRGPEAIFTILALHHRSLRRRSTSTRPRPGDRARRRPRRAPARCPTATCSPGQLVRLRRAQRGAGLPQRLSPPRPAPNPVSPAFLRWRVSEGLTHLVQPAHGSPVTGIPEGFQLTIPRCAQERVDGGVQGRDIAAVQVHDIA